ncbi:MAG: NADP-dependent malic enzyme, partial [Pseudorhodobacter sp.]|nr:NADP-dependent malic enzyme [Pseudorhodobacter sp.]
HMNYVRQVLARSGRHPIGALSLMILEDGPLFVADTQVNPIPTPEQIAATAIGAVRHARRFGVTPKVALCSHSNFGNLDSDSGRRMRMAMELLEQREVDFEFEGEMSLDAALDAELRTRMFPNARLHGAANILIFAYTDAANAARNMLKMKAGGLEVGPILMGLGNRAHIVTPSITARGLLNVSALAGSPVSLYG